MKKATFILTLAFFMSSFIPFANAAVTVPTGLTATPGTAGSITLNWATSTDAVGYAIYRNGTSTLLATTTGNSYVDSSLAASTTYTYYLASRDASSTLSDLSAPISATTVSDTSTPSVPANLTAMPISDQVINLSWTASNDNFSVLAYKIFRDNILRATTSSNSYSDTGLSASTSYAYNVSAIDTSNNESALTATVTATTLVQGATTTPPTASTTVKIAIKNGDKKGKLINLRSNEIIKVVVYGAAGFNAVDIDNATVTFAGAKQIRSETRDYDRDGIVDKMYSFRARQMKDLRDGDKVGVLTGKMKDGKEFRGEAAIRTKYAPKRVITPKKIEKIEKKIEKKLENIKKSLEDLKEKSEKAIEKVKEKGEKEGHEKKEKNEKTNKSNSKKRD